MEITKVVKPFIKGGGGGGPNTFGNIVYILYVCLNIYIIIIHTQII